MSKTATATALAVDAKTKSIAEYSADPSNPWAAWCLDNLSVGQHRFVQKYVYLTRLYMENRMTLALMEDRLNLIIVEFDLDRDAAYDAVESYENFRADLNAYRSAKVGA
jgi:hypothetical protein